MRKKLRIFSNIAIICLSVCMFAFGVYAANQVSVTTSGTVTFNASGVYAKIERTVVGAKVNPTKMEKMIDASIVDGDPIYMNADLEFDSQATPIVISFEITNMATESNRDIYVQVAEGATMTSNDNVTKVAYYLNSEIAIAPNTSAVINIELSVTDNNKSATATYDYSISLKDTSIGTVLDDTMATFTEITNDSDVIVGYSIGGFTSQTQSLEKITIPSSYNRLPVTKFDDAFDYGDNWSNMPATKHITFPNTIEYLGNNVFCDLNNLSIPGVVEIAANSLNGLINAIQITAPNLEIIGNMGLFPATGQDISKTKIIMLPKLKTIGDSGLANHSNVEYFILPETLVSMGYNATAGTAMTIRNFPLGLTTLKSDCFSLIKNKKITIPGTVNKIENGAFHYCENLEEVVIEDGVTIIGDYAFESYGCDLKKITIAASVESIGTGAFYNASESNTIPEVTYLGTSTQWNNIDISSGAFNNGVKVHCSDGVVISIG